MPVPDNTRLGGAELIGLARCPHCNVARPQMPLAWSSGDPTPRADGASRSRWAVYRCTTCGSLVTAQGRPAENVANPLIVEIFPDYVSASTDLPDRVRNYLEQAYRSLEAPDGAAMLAGSSVDAMLKEIGYEEGSVYSRIDRAVLDNRLTPNMGEWAHSVRLGSNRPRHSDADAPHVSPDEARQAVEFADALGQFLFVLTARISRGITAARTAD